MTASVHDLNNGFVSVLLTFCVDDEDWMRPLQVEGDQALVHWWYFPDRWVAMHATKSLMHDGSYNSRIPTKELDAQPEPPRPRKGLASAVVPCLTEQVVGS